MIYDRSHIVENFRGLIGLRPSYDNGNADAQIDQSLSVSLSGQYVNELHSFFTPENFANLAAQFSQFNVAEWLNNSSYKKGDVVRRTGLIYRANVANNALDPATNATEWSRTTLLSVWFQDKYDGAVLAVVDSLMEQKKLESHNKQLKGNTALYNSEGLKSNTIPKSGRFVGYEITIKEQDLSAVLQRLGVQLTGSTTLPIHTLYNGSEIDVSINYTTPNRFQYFNIEPQSFLADTGVITIGYYEDDLGQESAIELKTSIFDNPCSTCGGLDYGSYKAWSKWIDVKPMSKVGDEITYYTDINFGLNLVFSFKCDLSDFLIREKLSVIPALKAQLRVVFLEAIAGTVRNNKDADSLSILAYNQLRDWDNPDHPSIVLRRSLKALDFEFSGLNSQCLPCSNGTVRIRNRTI